MSTVTPLFFSQQKPKTLAEVIRDKLGIGSGRVEFKGMSQKRIIPNLVCPRCTKVQCNCEESITLEEKLRDSGLNISFSEDKLFSRHTPRSRRRASKIKKSKKIILTPSQRVQGQTARATSTAQGINELVSIAKKLERIKKPKFKSGNRQRRSIAVARSKADKQRARISGSRQNSANILAASQVLASPVLKGTVGINSTIVKALIDSEGFSERLYSQGTRKTEFVRRNERLLAAIQASKARFPSAFKKFSPKGKSIEIVRKRIETGKRVVPLRKPKPKPRRPRATKTTPRPRTTPQFIPQQPERGRPQSVFIPDQGRAPSAPSGSASSPQGQQVVIVQGGESRLQGQGTQRFENEILDALNNLTRRVSVNETNLIQLGKDATSLGKSTTMRSNEIKGIISRLTEYKKGFVEPKFRDIDQKLIDLGQGLKQKNGGDNGFKLPFGISTGIAIAAVGAIALLLVLKK